MELRGLFDLHLGAKVSSAYRMAAAASTVVAAGERTERAIVAASIALTANAPVNGDFGGAILPGMR